MRDERAQMMLLTAFILLIGFVALAGMVARVSQLPDQTLEERRRPSLQEARAMASGLEQALERLESLTIDPNDVTVTDASAFMQEVPGVVATLEAIAHARGFSVTAQPSACQEVSGNAELTVSVDLVRTDTHVSFDVTHVIAGRTCLPP